jgi:hypothetical protein
MLVTALLFVVVYKTILISYGYELQTDFRQCYHGVALLETIEVHRECLKAIGVRYIKYATSDGGLCRFDTRRRNHRQCQRTHSNDRVLCNHNYATCAVASNNNSTLVTTIAPTIVTQVATTRLTSATQQLISSTTAQSTTTRENCVCPASASNNEISSNSTTNMGVEESRQTYKVILLNVTEDAMSESRSDSTNRIEFVEMSCDDMLKTIVNRCSSTNI